MKTFRITMASLALVLTCSASAQQEQSSCFSLANTLSDHTIEASSSSYINAVFSQHCQQDGSRKSSGGGLGIETVIDLVPIKFQGDYKSAEDRMTNFCKVYASQYQATDASSLYKEKISRNALATIDQCLQLQTMGIQVKQRVTNVESADFYLRATNTSIFQLNGVDASPNVLCEGQINGKNQVFDKSVSTKIKTSVSFVCRRSGTPGPNNVTTFAEGFVTIMTNQNNYTLFWPMDERQSQNMATLIDQRITLLEGQLSIVKANVAPLVTADSQLAYKCPNGNSASYDAMWMYVGCNGQFSTIPTCTNVWSTGVRENLQCVPAGSLRLFK